MMPTPVKPTNTDATRTAKKPGAVSKGETPAPQGSFSLAEYFKGVRQEWHKISWPGREQVIAETGVVIFVVTLFTIVVFAIDKIFQFLIQLIT